MCAKRSAGAVAVAAAIVLLGAASGGAADNFLPSSVTAIPVAAGGTATAAQTIHLDALPPKGDILLALDLSGSMGSALASARSEATNIVSTLQANFAAVGGSAQFAVAGFDDYGGSNFDASHPTDVPWTLALGLTSDAAAVQTALNGLVLGDGGDTPEAYFRAFYEASVLPWRDGAQRFLIVLGDQTGHDDHQSLACWWCPDTTTTGGSLDPLGPGEPGPVGAAGAIAFLTGAKVKLSFIRYVTAPFPAVPLACHQQLAAATGGTAVDAGSSAQLTTQIANLVQVAAQHIGSITATARNLGEFGPDVASWVSFSGLPTAAVDMPAAGQDFPFTATVKPPADTTPGVYHLAVDVVADGVTRATETLDITVKTPLTGLQVSATPTSVGAGIDQVKIGDIPNAWLAFFAGSPLGAPIASTPVGSTPVGSTPIGSTPVGSTPVGSTPVGSTPIGSTPVGSTPVGSTGLFDLPIGSTPVGSTALASLLLSQIPLCGDIPLPGTTQAQCQTDGATWSAVLAGTDFAGKPTNALSLADVLANADVKTRLKALPMRDISFATTLFKSVHWSSLLIGSTPLQSLPVPSGYSTWCDALADNGGSCANVDAFTTVLQMDVGGQLGSTPIGSTPVGSTPIGSTPVGSTPVGSTAVTASKLATIPLSSIVPTTGIVDCTTAGFDCTGKTLGDAYQANRIVPAATFSAPALVTAMNAAGITVNDLLVAVLGAAGLPWQSLPVQGLQPYSLTQPHVTYTVSANVDCSVLSDYSVYIRLPDGFFPVNGSAKVALNGGTPQPAGAPDVIFPTLSVPIDSVAVITPGASLDATPYYRWTAPCGDLGSLVPAVLTFDSFVGLNTGTFTADAAVTAGTFSLAASDAAPVTVGQNGEPGNDDAGKAATVNPDTLVAGHIGATGDQDFYNVNLDGLPRGTKVSVFLKVPTGADFDLTISKQAAQGFFSTPVASTPIASTPIEDTGIGFSTAGQAVPSETLQDIPVGSTPVGSTPVGSTPVASTSTNRGSANEAAQVITTGEGGVATIGVSGYNGSTSAKPYVLRVQETPPPPVPPSCPARAISPSASAQGSLPATLPTTTKSLFLVNKQRLTAMYGATGVTNLLNALSTLAARSEVSGTVLQVDGNAAVRQAYAQWDAIPCDIGRANDVVRSINDVVASYRNTATGLPNLHYIVLLGTDEALPMARTPDPVTLSPEENEAADLAFTTNGLTQGNALYNTAAQNYILTDGAYGAFTSIPWLGHDLLLPQISISRLVETPGDMTAQVNRYLQSSGLAGSPQTAPGTLAASSAIVTGYDFLADGASSVRSNLLARFPGLSTLDTIGAAPGRASINNPAVLPAQAPWTATDIKSGFLQSATPASIASLNAHYNHYELEAADGTTLAGSADLTASIASRILFAMGCHGGLNVANTLGGTTGKFLDWSEVNAKNLVAMYLANTGYGYGDSASVALSERLLSLYAKNLHSDSGSVGEQWVTALQQYFATAGAYDVYDEKVMEETTFFGLPFWHFSTAGTGAAGPTALPTTPDSITGVQSSTLSFPGAGATTQDQFGLYRPILPITSQEVTSSSLSARSVWVKSLQTNDTNATATLGLPTIDLAAHEPKPTIRPIFFPASPFMLEHANMFGKQRDYINVSDQFRPDPSSTTGAGVRRHVVGASLEIFYSNSPDFVAPLISQVTVTFGAGNAHVVARITDDSGTVAEAAALVNDGTWHYVQLTKLAADPTVWSGDVAVTQDPEVFVEASDGPNVAYSANKGSNFTSTSSSATVGPQILIQAPFGTYAPNQAVNATYQCLPADPGTSCVGTVPSGSAIDTGTFGLHTFTVKAKDSAGNETSLVRTYFVGYPFKGFFAPVDNEPVLNSVAAGRAIPVKFSLGGNQGLDIFAAGYPKSQQIACDATAPADGIETTLTAGGSSLSYDQGADQYNYVWKTDTTWGGTCRALVLKLKDGSTHRANFKFTK